MTSLAGRALSGAHAPQAATAAAAPSAASPTSTSASRRSPSGAVNSTSLGLSTRTQPAGSEKVAPDGIVADTAEATPAGADADWAAAGSDAPPARRNAMSERVWRMRSVSGGQGDAV